MSDSPPEQFRIAELAQRTGLTPRTIRYYVAEELLPPPVGSGPQRLYGPDHVLRLEAIKRLKGQYLPLTEIRRRLAGASRKDLEAILAAASSEPGESALDYLAAIQSDVPSLVLPPPRHPRPSTSSFIASLGSPSTKPPSLGLGSAEAIHSRPEAIELGRPDDVANSNRESLGETVWNRVVLAPGVELNYQLSGDRVRDATVLRLIRTARQILGTVS